MTDNQERFHSAADWRGVLNRFAPAFLAFLQKNGRCSRPHALDCFRAFMADPRLSPALDAALADLKLEHGGVRKLLFQELSRFAAEDSRCKSCRHSTLEDAASAAERIANDLNASRLFDVVWAQQVITTALARMKMQCQGENKMDVWTLFDQRLCIPILADKSPVPYRVLVERLGIKSPAQAHQLLSAGKQMFSDFLTRAIAEYESDTDRINQEKSELHSILAQS